MRSPFKFLDSYTLKDKDVFFGRDKEIETLYNLVHKTPLVLVYGPSGTGKTSLVQCGLSTRFDGPDWLPFHIRKKENINLSLRKALNSALENKKADNLTDAVDELFYTYFRPVYLIFDQFEELFILGTEAEQQQFMTEIRELLDAQLPCKVVFIMREEYIGEFYEFEKELPNIFDHKLRVESMSSKRVREVMLQSFKKFNITLEAPADALCQTMIDNISAGKSGIPLTYLQVYLDMLYREDFTRTYPNGASSQALLPLKITKTEVNKFGKIDDVLDRYIKKQVNKLQKKVNQLNPNINEQSVTMTLDAFVTTEGTKRPVYYIREEENFLLEKSIKNQINLPDSILNFQLAELEKSRILRFGENQIELAHDSLALLIDRQRTDFQRQLNDLRLRILGDYRTWKETGEFLSKKRLSTYEDFLPDLRLSGKLQNFIENSRKDIENKELLELNQKERELKLVNEKLQTEKRSRRKQRMFSFALCISLLISIVIGRWAFNQKQLAISRYLEATKERNTAIANDFAFKAKQLLQESYRTEAFNLAAFTNSFIQKENNKITPVLRDAVYFSSQNDNNDIPWSMSFQGHNDDVNSVKLSHNELWLITGSDDSTAKLWDAKTGKELHSFRGHKDVINSVCFSSDDKWIITGSDDETAKLWNTKTGKEIYTFEGHSDVINSVCFSSDDEWIITGSDDRTAKIWDLESKNEIQSFKGHGRGVLSVNLSKNKKLLITGSSDTTAKLWDAKTGREIQSFEGHNSIISSVKFSSTEKWLATGSNDNTAKLWNIKTGKEIQSFEGHTQPIISLCFDSSDKRIFTASWDKTVKIWNAKLGRETQTLSGHGEDILSVNLSLDDKTLVTGSADNTAKLWKLKSSTTQELIGHNFSVSSASFFSNGNKLVTGSWDKTAKSWDLKTGKKIHSFVGHNHYVTSVDISSDESKLITGSWDDTAILWDLKTGKRIRSFQGHNGIITSLDISANDKKLVTGSTDYTAKLWSLKTGKEISSFVGHDGYITSVVISSDESKLVTGSTDNSAKLWDLKTGKLIRSFEGHDNYVTSVSLSFDGKWLATGSTDNTAKLWEVETGKEVQSFIGHEYYIYSVRLLANGKKLLTGSWDHTAKLWSTKTGKEIRSFKGHTEEINSINTSIKENKLVTSSADNSVRIWDLDKEWKLTAEDLVNEIPLPKSISSVEFKRFDLHSILLSNKQRQTEWLSEEEDVSLLYSIAFNLTESNKSNNNPTEYNSSFDLANRIYQKLLTLDESQVYIEKCAANYREWSKNLLRIQKYQEAREKAVLAYRLYPNFENLLQTKIVLTKENTGITIFEALSLDDSFDLEQAALYFKSNGKLTAAKKLYQKSYELYPLQRIKREIEEL